MNRKTMVCTLIFMGVLLLFCQVVFARPQVEIVQSSVRAEKALPELVQKRMQSTVSVIGEQLMAGKAVDEISTGRAGFEKIIHEVFDKVLVGYSVKQVLITPGEQTKIAVELVPWAQVINKIYVSVEVEGMTPEIEALIRHDLAGLENVFHRGLDGLPVAAADWTNGVMKRSLNEYMEKNLPEFRADFDLIPGDNATIKVVVYPRLPVVRTIDLSMRSDTIPNFTLLNQRQLLEGRTNMLIGVPVKFVARHEKYFSELFAKTLDELAVFRELGIRTKVTLHTAEKMEIMSRSDTKRYTIRLKGWVDIGRNNMNNRKTMFRLHVGHNFTDEDEIFTWVDLYPQNVQCDWAVGYRHELLKGTDAHIRYDIRKRRLAFGVDQRLAPKWFLRYEYRWADQMGEAGLRYQMHDFLGLEYVHDKKDNWLRVIGNF